jgi:hypothetical protein
MFLGQYETAVEAADEMIATIPSELLRVEVPPMADWLEGFIPMKMHVLIRFGKWQEIIDTPLPEDQELYSVTTAMIHYAKGVALAATSRVYEAEREADLFEAAFKRVPDTRFVFNNRCLDILAIAAEMLSGELQYRKGNIDAASPTCAGRLNSTMGCPTTSRGAGCSRPDTRTAPCCSNKDGSRKRRPCTGPTLVSTASCRGPTSTPTTSGACMATTSALFWG